jgi:hypothetical protein
MRLHAIHHRTAVPAARRSIVPLPNDERQRVSRRSRHAWVAVATALVALLAYGATAQAQTLNLCSAKKKGCVAKKAQALLKCHAKAEKKGEAVDPLCVQKAKDKFDGGADPTKGCFEKLEAKGGCFTYNDTAALEAKIDAFVQDVVCELDPAAPGCECPTTLTFTDTPAFGGIPLPVIDLGWTGEAHDASILSDSAVTVAVTSCAGSRPSCGACTYAGPIANGPGELDSQRCQGDSAIHCTTDLDCPGTAPCKFFSGSYLPLAGGGVSSCVESTFTAGISGTFDLDTGDGSGAERVTWRIFSGPTVSQPCPQCLGDATTNDGTKGGTCSAGSHAGEACDANGSSPNEAFGTTSLDCPPSPGNLIATLPLDLSTSTGNTSRTFTAASPDCRAPGFTGNKCQCDTCDNAAATPCSSNADCVAVGAAVCGGKRCLGGGNNGAACTATSECPGGACAVPGSSTQPNGCTLGPADCVPGDQGPLGIPNERHCMNGPAETFCGPVETFRGCGADSDCPHPGDTCSITRYRECFDKGIIGDTVTASGQADLSDPFLGSLSCVGPTSSGAVNATAGLPGLVRLERFVHVERGAGPLPPCAAGTRVGAACWLFGTTGQSCTTVCTSQGLSVDPATTSYSGSTGTDDHCNAVLDALAAGPGNLPFVTTDCGVADECILAVSGLDTQRARCTHTPTDPGASSPYHRRACACATP